MKRLNWNRRTITTVSIAFLLAASVGVMGVWLLLSGQPGTGMMESGDRAYIMESGSYPGMMGQDAMPENMMGAPANRGIVGGYTGAVGLLMILVFIGLVGILVYALLRERPGQPQAAACWNCERPIETDWVNCPYCGVALNQDDNSPRTQEIL